MVHSALFQAGPVPIRKASPDSTSRSSYHGQSNAIPRASKYDTSVIRHHLELLGGGVPDGEIGPDLNSNSSGAVPIKAAYLENSGPRPDSRRRLPVRPTGCYSPQITERGWEVTRRQEAWENDFAQADRVDDVSPLMYDISQLKEWSIVYHVAKCLLVSIRMRKRMTS
jgi:hypothetical protein